MKQITKYSLSLAVFLNLLINSTKSTFAQTKEWSDRCIANGDVATIQGFECLFFNILQIIVFFAGLAFFFMFIAGGFQYIFSSNDPKKVAAASSTLTMSIIGLIGIIASSLIMKFIYDFTGINVVDFVIPK